MQDPMLTIAHSIHAEYRAEAAQAAQIAGARTTPKAHMTVSFARVRGGIAHLLLALAARLAVPAAPIGNTLTTRVS